MTTDSEEIRELVDNWILWRDAGDWDRFRTVWRPEGRVFATWFQGTGDEFIKMSREGWERGVSILRTHNGSTIEVAGDQAIAQTKMTIAQRAEVDGVLCDVVVQRPFLRLPRPAERPLGHGAPPAHLRAGPDRPGGVRHPPGLGRGAARPVPRGLPAPRLPANEDWLPGQDRHAGITGPRTEALYALGRAWLANPGTGPGAVLGAWS